MAYHFFSGVYTADQIFRSEFLKHVREIGYEIVCVAPHVMGLEGEEPEVKEYLVVSRQPQEE
jgi:hypothetical protein